MKRLINKVKIFVNKNEDSLILKGKIIELLKKYCFEVVEEDYDLGIAIGGDGSFLRMLKQTNFNNKVYYVGINSGTLGFLQEIKPQDVELFIARINNNDFKLEEISIQETIVKTKKVRRYFFP